ncbi:MAG: FtsX-like permease family protein, partial [Alphaproteobacteria bacterium]|nr:FtsX-like permease family protein [Alphaproteobacteria bacterium]
SEVRFPNGTFQNFRVIGVDDTSLHGAPKPVDGGMPSVLRAPDAVIVDPGGTEGKLQTPVNIKDQWPFDGPHLHVATQILERGDVLQINDHRVVVAGRSHTFPRWPATPLIYATASNARRFLLPERRQLTFIMARAQPGVSPLRLALAIEARTGLKARTKAAFKKDTVLWLFRNSEDVGDIASMISIAMLVGFGVTGVMLYMFTTDNLRQYAVLKAMGAPTRLLSMMVLVQAGLCGVLGTGMGLGLCSIAGELVIADGRPFRMIWFTPLIGGLAVILVSLIAAMISVRPVFKLEPGMVFSGR